MAIKISNQITFTEHKKIVEIKEWYLATSTSTGVTTQTTGWTESIQTMDRTNKYLWNYEEIIYSIGSSDISDPVIIGVYGETGSGLQVKYISSLIQPIIKDNDVSEWSDTIPTPVNGQKIYMTQKISTDINWSTPIQISAVDGEPGKDGASVEYVYYRSKEEAELSPPYYTNDNLTVGWTDSPQGITEVYKYEYVSVRTKPSGIFWGSFSKPVIWSKWGEKGQDGDGVEYKYYLSNSNVIPSYSVGDSKWTDDPQGVSIEYQYEYVVQIKTSGESSITSSPSLWAKFGEDGVGIVAVKNYYLVTSDPIFPTSPEWLETIPMLSPTNKYLWNYEVIDYTDGGSTETDPAIIGAYGDSGADGSDAVDFQIYSVDGFEFSSLLTSIELKTVAFKAGNKIENDDIVYRWKWWNSESTLDDKYEIISDATLSSLTISIDDIYAFSSLKCEMTYDGITYEDYVTLTEKATVYTATAKFFNGTNIIAAEDDYLIVYIELYKDNELEELLYGNSVYKSDANSVQENVIITDIDGEYSDGDTMYFVCKNTYEGADGYDVILGQYASEQWNVSESNYIYKNDLFAYTTSPVVFVPKEKISRSLNINFEIYDGNTIIARTAAMVLDFNDPTISSSSPADPRNGQLWLDTSVSPSILKMWDGSKWVNSGYQNGNVVYTSKPEDGYSEGDLWILSEEDAELFEGFGPGTMLKATITSASFDTTHWVDVDEEGTEQKNNIKQYFLFNKDTGLRIGQSDDQFYVNISSTEMGFYDATSGTAQKVVSISNQSATIKNLTVEDNAKFNCEVQFGNFILKTESNGSLSLALAT